MKILSNFDGGNILVDSFRKTEDIRLRIRHDTEASYLQWFYFQLQGVAGYPCVMHIVNAGDAFEPSGWIDYKVCASYDRQTWFRVSTQYDGEKLTIQHTPRKNSVYYAYFPPFSFEQHQNLIHQAQTSELCVIESLGQTIEGRSMDCLIAGNPGPNKKTIWIIARQHPGESMASWFMSGLIPRLLDENDPVSRTLLDKAVFYMVPNMNPDGSVHGNIRANAAGVNLNREWAHPSKEKSPEVFYVLKKMTETGVDLNLDIHGEEAIPYNFITTLEGIPGFTPRLKSLQESFVDNWMRISPDLQNEKGYPRDEPGKANLEICSKQIAQRFDCLSLTIEMPFKDNQNLPDPVFGWSPERSARFGESVINAIFSVVDQLR